MNEREGVYFSVEMAKVCDLLAEFVEREYEKGKMLKYAKDFRNFAKLFRGGKHGKKTNKTTARR